MRSTIPQLSRSVRRSSLCLLALMSALTVLANWSAESAGIRSAAQSTTPDSGLLAGNQATAARNKISLDSYGDQNNATDEAGVTSTISLNDYSVSRFDNPRSLLAGEHPYAVGSRSAACQRAFNPRQHTGHVQPLRSRRCSRPKSSRRLCVPRQRPICPVLAPLIRESDEMHCCCEPRG